jgi:hypothetical protein
MRKLVRVNDLPVTVVGVVAPEFTGIQQSNGEAPDVGLPLTFEPQLRGEAGPAQSRSTSTSSLLTLRSSLSDDAN